MLQSSKNYKTLKQTANDVIKADAIEKTVLTNILDLKNDIIQKAKNSAINLEEFVTISESVNNIIRHIIKVQMITQIKLKKIKDLIQKVEILTEHDYVEDESTEV